MKQFFYSVLKYSLTFLFFFFCIIGSISAQAFITTWVTTDNTITIPTSGGGYNYNVTWTNLTNAGVGDGAITARTGNHTITGLQNGSTYRVNISGAFPHFFMNNNATERTKLRTIAQWGTIAWTSMNSAFRGCTNLTYTATDAPNLAGLTDMSNMFRGCSAFNGNATMNTWNTSAVTNMGAMFESATSFNQNIGGWNTAAVTNMAAMFFSTTAFNGNIGGWNTVAVTDMSFMFNLATSFNQNIGGWNTANVILMNSMFQNASAFNQNISTWNTSNVTNMGAMFWNVGSFNQNIGGWNTANVTNMGGMFLGASSFNQNIGGWNTANVTAMNGMFQNATSFNQSLATWNMGAVTTAATMFNNSGLLVGNYDATLIGWAGQTLQAGVALGATGLQYCTAVAARATLTSAPKNWVITGDVLDCAATFFITTWVTTDNTITIPTSGGGYNYNVTWTNLTNAGVGDGAITARTGNHTITGLQNGSTYRVNISGAFPHFFMNNNATERTKLRTIAQWGTIAWTSMFNAFQGCTNLTYTATDVPNLAGVTDMSSMFSGCTAFNGNVTMNTWNTATINRMGAMFLNATAFNGNIGGWNTAAVTNMGSTFNGATSFNQNISTWNTGLVTDMSFMFNLATSFNQNIGGWNTVNVTLMNSMFSLATSFNQNISAWNTVAVTNMNFMFNGATVFNGNIGGWNTVNVTLMNSMFQNATSFNQNISTWNTSNVTNMGAMFWNVGSFNQNIGGWNTSNVTNMGGMFLGATSFNQNIGGWNTANVTNMNSMFNGATSFNQNIGGWNTANVTNMSNMFGGAASFNQNISNWNTAAVTNMSLMFNLATSFNQSLATWNMGAVTNAATMFNNSGLLVGNYDATLVGWAGQTLQAGIALGATGLQYCTAVAARATLTSAPKNWIITGDVINCAATPIAFAATTITPFSFTANWSVSNNATSYILEISRFANFSAIYLSYALTQTIMQIIDLPTGIYYYRVRAVNGAGVQSANSNIIGVSLPQILAPIAISATGVKSTEFLARWQLAPNGGASYFQIDVAEDANFTRMVTGYNNLVVRGDITALIKDLRPFTTYFYRVRAVAGISIANISPNSNVISVTTLPAPPKAIEALNITSNGFQARWEALQGITSFRLDVSSDKDFTILLVNDAIVIGASFTVTNLPIATAYFYRLRVVTVRLQSFSLVPMTSENSNIIEVKPIPVAPVATAATNIKDNVFTANWREVAGADAYLLDVSEQANFASTLAGFKDLEVKGASKEITGLKEGKAYYYRLRASNSSGNSLYSNIIEVIMLPSVPQNLVLVSATLQQINVSWTASKSELPLTYLIDVASNSGFTNIIVKDRTSTLTNLSITAAFEAGKEYYVRVKARHSRNGESEYSETLIIKMIPAIPLSLVMSKVTENSFNLAWASALGADSYEIEVATTANFTPIFRSLTATTTNIDVSGLNSLQQYFCRVRAVNKTGKSANSLAANTITLPNPTTTNKAKNVGSQQFTAAWNVSTQVNTYILEVAKNEGFTDILAGFSGVEISNVLERLVSWQGRESELYYRVRVVATVQGQRLVSRPSNIQKVRILQVPFGFRFTNVKQTSFDVDWNATDGAEEYEVSLSIDNFATVLAAYSQVKVSLPSIKLEKLEGNRPYQIRVKALSSDGASDNGNASQMTLPLFPQEVYIRRLSTTRTTEIQWQYFSLPLSRLSNMRFVVERSDIDNAPFRPISSALTLADSRSLRYDDVTGTQRLQATYRLRISNEAGEVIFNIPKRIITAVDNGLIDENAVVLYPNPSSDVFRLQIQKIASKSARVRVFDNIGRLVKIWEEIKSVNESEFDISQLATGKYVVEISWEKQSMYLPLIKE